MVTSFDPSMLSLTPSKVREYQACPQQYKLSQSAPRSSDNASPSLSFGNSMHEALEEIHANCLLKSPEVDCRQILGRHWKAEGYNNNEESNQFFDRGIHALERYVEVIGRSVGQVISTELYLSRVVRFDSVRVKFGCKVDRLELHPSGVLEVLDYKTNASGKVPTQEYLGDDLATFIYYVLVRLTYPEMHRVVVSQLNVLTLAKVEVEYDGTKIAAHKKSLSDLVMKIKANDFGPRPSGVCSWCRVRDLCPAFGPDTDLEHLV